MSPSAKVYRFPCHVLFAALALLAGAMFNPQPLTAQSECAFCEWCEDSEGSGWACCSYDPAGDVQNCTQPQQYSCAGTIGGGPCGLTFGTIGLDGSLAWSNEVDAEGFEYEYIRQGEKVIRRSCDGAILGRQINSELRQELLDRSRRIVL